MESLLTAVEASEHVNNRWYDPSVYHTLTEMKGYNLCSFSPPYGENRGLFCGNKASLTTGGINKYRCELCQSKKATTIKIHPRWVSLEYYFSSCTDLCSYIPLEGDNFGDFCGLPAIKTQCDKKDYRCELCISKNSNLVLYNSYLEINREVNTKKRKLTEERWMTTHKYIKIQTANPKNYLCSYSPACGDKIKHHCCNPAIIGDKDCFWEYRCTGCKSKTNKSTISTFMKHLLKAG
jgi:hypothetical protein